MPFLVFQSFGPAELLIILAIVVVLFGASRIAGIGGAMGRAIREFRQEMKRPEEESDQGEERETAKAEPEEKKS
ncbi:MAG: twin-arginine translocase TatA/TatE family subunit [Dehalococcoidia bacterium]